MKELLELKTKEVRVYRHYNMRLSSVRRSMKCRDTGAKPYTASYPEAHLFRLGAVAVFLVMLCTPPWHIRLKARVDQASY